MATNHPEAAPLDTPYYIPSTAECNADIWNAVT
jgi:hypothetical protein